jgi:RNA polymerase sigma-70 factor (ECF subfamily)
MMVVRTTETSVEMSSMRGGASDASVCDDDVAAAVRDPAARWRAIEACRDYLRLIARRGRLSNDAGLPATSDLVQGTFVEAWRQFSRFRGRTPGQLRAWLRAILIHASLNARRRPRVRLLGSGRQVAEAAFASTPSPSQAAQDKASREALDAALGALPDRDRHVIHLRLWDRLSFVEIGRRMSLSEDAARMVYARALARLRGSMRPGHDPG